MSNHFSALKALYAAAPINAFYKPSMELAEGSATIEMTVTTDMFHSAGAAHGSVCFKILDDACFFAANSLEPDFFVLTSSFTTYLTRPVVAGKLRATGKVVSQSKTQFIVEAVAFNADDKEVGRGNGVFVRSKMPLADIPAYGE